VTVRAAEALGLEQREAALLARIESVRFAADEAIEARVSREDRSFERGERARSMAR
jgi:hypothetical protein